MSNDLFQAPDYFNMDELLSEEHKLIRDTAREWVKKNITNNEGLSTSYFSRNKY